MILCWIAKRTGLRSTNISLTLFATANMASSKSGPLPPRMAKVPWTTMSIFRYATPRSYNFLTCSYRKNASVIFLYQEYFVVQKLKISKYRNLLTATHSTEPMSPYSSAPQLQNTMVLLGLQPREKKAFHNVSMYPEIFAYVNGYLRTIEFPEHVHFVRSYSCLKVQYRFQNGASFRDKNIIASCGHEKDQTLFNKRNKNSGYFRHDGGASDWVHSSNGPSISMIPQQNITICG